MMDFDYSELEDVELTLETEDGEEIDLELAYVFEYKGQDFAAFGEVGTEEDEERSVYFFLLNLKQKKGDEAEVEFEYIDDDEVAEELLDVFLQILASQEEEGVDLGDYGIEDEDDDEDDGDEDSRWDQFIHKKLDD